MDVMRGGQRLCAVQFSDGSEDDIFTAAEWSLANAGAVLSEQKAQAAGEKLRPAAKTPKRKQCLDAG